MSEQLELYRIMVEEVRDARGARRDASNQYLTTNIAGLLGLHALAGGGDSEVTVGPLAMPTAQAPIQLLFGYTFILILICLIWQTSNRYYAFLLRAKMRQLDKLEQQLTSQPLREEYMSFGGTRSGRFFALERSLPLFFVIAYVMFLAYQVTWADLISALHLQFQFIQALF